MKKRQAIALPPRIKKAVARLKWPVLGFLLCAGQMAGVYAPFALAAVAAAGIRLPGLAAVMGVAGGAFLFMDFQSGLRCTAAAILIFAANTALYDTAVYKKPYFRPACAAFFLLLVQSIYLLGRSGQSWLLALCAAVTAAGAAWLTVIRQGKWGVLCGLVLAAVPVTAFSFSVGRALMMALLLALCRGMHYALVELYVLVQTAAAYEKLGKRREAAELLRERCGEKPVLLATHDREAIRLLGWPVVELENA